MSENVMNENAINENAINREREIGQRTPLFAAADLDGFRTRWGGIQTGFVDEPRKAVTRSCRS
jgi:hypothetical protein